MGATFTESLIMPLRGMPVVKSPTGNSAALGAFGVSGGTPSSPTYQIGLAWSGFKLRYTALFRLPVAIPRAAYSTGVP